MCAYSFKLFSFISVFDLGWSDVRNMARFKCKHDWEIISDYSRKGTIEWSSVLKCRKCLVCMSVREVAELELWKHVVGIQKWLSIGAILIAAFSLLISLLD